MVLSSAVAADLSKAYRSNPKRDGQDDQGWRDQQEQKLLRLTLDRCSLFGLTIGLKVLEIGYAESSLRAVFEKSLQDVGYRHFDLLGSGDASPPRAAALEAFLNHVHDTFDVIILNHIWHCVAAEEIEGIVRRATGRMRPNAILILFDYFDVKLSAPSDLVGAGSRYLQQLGGALCEAPHLVHNFDLLPGARPHAGTQPMHFRAAFRGTVEDPACDFADDDFTFEMERPFGRSLAKGPRFGVYRGKWNLLIGRSGSGKTTFLRALQGDLQSHTPGPRSFPSANYFNMPQNVDVFESLSPVQNVRAYGGSPAQAVGYFEELGMGKDFQDRSHAVQISGGERQRLLVAQIIAADPELLILDEPSKGLDRAGRLVIFNALAERFAAAEANDAATVICADHDFAGIYHLFDYVFELRDGIQTLVWEKHAA